MVQPERERVIFMEKLLEELKQEQSCCEICPNFNSFGTDVCVGCSVYSQINELENKINAMDTS